MRSKLSFWRYPDGSPIRSSTSSTLILTGTIGRPVGRCVTPRTVENLSDLGNAFVQVRPTVYTIGQEGAR